MRLQPIRVFCFHHVSDAYDSLTMWECDWIQTETFKNKVIQLKESGVEFISLQDAHYKLKHDWIRWKKYAVLTADDGYISMLNILPWLEKQQIPITLFVNPAYILGEDNREKGTSLTLREIEKVLELGEGNVQIASHGWNHRLCSEMTMQEFEENVNRCELFFSQYKKSYIPFFAYPCGKNTTQHDKYLLTQNIVPVLMDGVKNYNDASAIHRELLV